MKDSALNYVANLSKRNIDNEGVIFFFSETMKHLFSIDKVLVLWGYYIWVCRRTKGKRSGVKLWFVNVIYMENQVVFS